MIEDTSDQGLPQPLPSMLFRHNDIEDHRLEGEIAQRPGKTCDPALAIETELKQVAMREHMGDVLKAPLLRPPFPTVESMEFTVSLGG